MYAENKTFYNADVNFRSVLFLLQGTFSLIVEAWHEPTSARNSGNDNTVIFNSQTHHVYILYSLMLAHTLGSRIM